MWHIWNRSRYDRDPDTRRVKRTVRDESEWIVTPAPHLRIITNALWARVKARQETIHQESANIRAALHINARTGRGPKYLFSGLVFCGQCSNKFVIVDPLRYACSGWLYRGQSVCANTIKVSGSWWNGSYWAQSRPISLPRKGWPGFNRK